ncbi:MAG TPA: heparan-alpha-glucosaminide N-acetyltransferase domain-containing protein [Planctomycetota bacterium]|nr:heparan-alpha-glucosaminide N-acetyltransferase domain-containing protein [Planctomycetota bacterium]
MSTASASPLPTVSPALPPLLKGTTAGRLVSVDALRGFDMIWILGGDALVQAIHKLCGDPVTGAVARQFDHCGWAGFHIEDLIFPLFVFIAGVSLVFSLTKTIAREGRTAALGRVVRRGLLLVLVGTIYYGGFTDGWDHVRWVGVLQRIGLAYLFAGVLFCFLSPRGLAAACVALLVGYWGLMSFVPIRDIHLNKDTFAHAAAASGTTDDHQVFAATTATVSGKFEPGYNLSDHVDFQYLSGRKWDHYYDPEGLLSTIPAIATCLLGVLAGLALRSSALTDGRRLAWLVGSGVALIVVGWAWDAQFPVIKKIWSSSFVLVAGGWSLLLLAAFHWLVDLRG